MSSSSDDAYAATGLTRATRSFRVFYEGGLGVKTCVRSLTPQCQMPGESCRVKRLSKFTGCEHGWLMALDTTA